MTEPVRLIKLETHLDIRRGNITVIEDISFPIKRVFTIYNVPVKIMRGGHAHKTCHQFFVAVCGAVLVKTGDGKEYLLDCPDMGLYVPPKNTVHLLFLTENTTLMVLASQKYDKNDYLYSEEIK